MRLHPEFHVSCFKPAISGPLDEGEVRPVEPKVIKVDGEPAYRVKELLDSRRRRGALKFLVHWEGYGLEERSWIPAKDVLSQELKDSISVGHSAQLLALGPPSQGFRRTQGCFALLPRSRSWRVTVTSGKPPPHLVRRQLLWPWGLSVGVVYGC